MHNNFLDKRRRYLRLQPDRVELALPEHFEAAYPKFINLLKFYYEFQADEKPTELLHHLFATRDITETDITLLSYIEDELLLGDAYFESFATGEAAKRAAANFSSTLFRSKGTKFSIQWFFRSFFGIDVEVVETKDNVFKVGEVDSRIGPNSLRYLTDDKLYQTWAYLVRSEVPISEWQDIFKLFVHPAGMYLGGELLISDDAFKQLLTVDSDNIITKETIPFYQLQITPDAEESEGTTFAFNFERLAATGNKFQDGNTEWQFAQYTASIAGPDDGVAKFDNVREYRIFWNGVQVYENFVTGFGSTLTTINGAFTTTGNTYNRGFVVGSQFTAKYNPSVQGDIYSVEEELTTIPDDQYKFFIEKGTTEVEDFLYSADSTFPDSANKVSFITSGGSKIIRVRTFHDSDETEGNETFFAHFEDANGRSLFREAITLEDVIASYTLTPSTTSMNEGDSVQFTVNGLSVPNNGNTTLWYEVIPVTADSADFDSDTAFRDVNTNERIPVFIRNSTAEFSVIALRDNITATDGEGDETFRVKLYTDPTTGIVKATSDLITVANVDPTIGLSNVEIIEGSDVVVTINTDDTIVGQTASWDIDYGVGTDRRITSLTGTVIITGANDEYTLTSTTVADSYNGTGLESINISLDNYTGVTDTATFQILDRDAELLNASALQTGLTNGDTVTFRVLARNAKDGYGTQDSVQWYIDLNGNADSNDFDPILSNHNENTAGAFDFTENSDRISLTLAAGAESINETFDFVAFNTNGDSVRVGYTIIGDDKYALQTLVAGSGDSANDTMDEGDTIEFLFTTTDADGDYLVYTAKGTQGDVDPLPTPTTDKNSVLYGLQYFSDDLIFNNASNISATDVLNVSGYLKQQKVKVENGEGRFQIQAKSDLATEVVESFIVGVAADSASRNARQGLTSVEVEIQPTSEGLYTISVPDTIEGNDIVTTVSTTSAAGNLNGGVYHSEKVTVFIRGTASILDPADSRVVDDVIINPDQFQRLFFDGPSQSATFSSSTTASNTLNGTVQQIAEARVIEAGPYNSIGKLVASTTFNLLDAAATTTLSTDQGGNIVDEGEIITFTFDGNNLADGEYYYHISDIVPQVTTADVTSGTSLIECTDTNGIQVGMQVREAGFSDDATVISVNSGAKTVTMSENATSTVSSGAEIYFATSAIWLDFNEQSASRKPYGSFTRSGSANTFEVETVLDADEPSGGTESFTMQVNDGIPPSSSSVNVIKTRSFTINDLTPSSANLQWNDTSGDLGPESQTPTPIGPTTQTLTSNGGGGIGIPSGYAGIRVTPDFEIYTDIASSSSFVAPLVDSDFAGYWLDDRTGADNTKFQIKFSYASGSGADPNNAVEGNITNEWLTLDEIRTYAASPVTPGVDQTTTIDEVVVCSLRQIDGNGDVVSGNSAVLTVTFDVSTTYYEFVIGDINYNIGYIPITFGTG